MLQDKAVNTLVSFRYLLKRHLVEEPESVPLDWVGVSMSRVDGGRGRKADRPSEITVATDSLDRRILAELFRSSDRSNKVLSEAVGVTRSTFEYRLRRLMDERVLVGFINVIPPTRLGMSTFKIIVSLRRFDSSAWDDLIRFSEENPNIVNIIHCIGKWDYELGVEVNNPNEAFQISQKLSLFLGERLGSLAVIPVFQQIVPTNFLGMDSEAR
jgi:DNA-binding Lrp family transcriptional regulator